MSKFVYEGQVKFLLIDRKLCAVELGNVYSEDPLAQVVTEWLDVGERVVIDRIDVVLYNVLAIGGRNQLCKALPGLFGR